MNPPDQPTPRTDAAYFAPDSTMYSLAGEMKLLERELAAAKAECERLKNYDFWKDAAKTRAECLAIASSQMLTYEQTIARLRAEVERWQAVASEMSAEREHNANEASRVRAEVERLTESLAQERKLCAHMIESHDKQVDRAERAEAEVSAFKKLFLEFGEHDATKDKARLDWLEKNWTRWPIARQADTIRDAIDALKGTPTL